MGLSLLRTILSESSKFRVFSFILPAEAEHRRLKLADDSQPPEILLLAGSAAAVSSYGTTQILLALDNGKALNRYCNKKIGRQHAFNNPICEVPGRNHARGEGRHARVRLDLSSPGAAPDL
jgi:hypothetical protein